jgi:U4/U6.U5 tri-snRNP-associated protein 3
MGSPSPKRRKERHRDRTRRRKRSRSRKRSGERRKKYRSSDSDHEGYNRSRSRSKSLEEEQRRRSPTTSSFRAVDKFKRKTQSPSSEVDEQEMMKVMGFKGFASTKGKKVEGNDVGEVHVILKRKYRQYMNRKGGFNRPLDFVA